MVQNKTEATILGPECRLSGELELEGDAVLEGRFHGTLRVHGGLELAESAELSGTVEARWLRVAGSVDAEVSVDGEVELLHSGRLRGHVRTSHLRVDDGAVFDGDVEMVAEGDRREEPAEKRQESGEKNPEPAAAGRPAPILARVEFVDEDRSVVGTITTAPDETRPDRDRDEPAISGGAPPRDAPVTLVVDEDEGDHAAGPVNAILRRRRSSALPDST